jgi:O-antigen/teichoic acid export membrane protein
MGIYVVILKWAVEGAVYGYVLINLVLLSFTFVILKRFHQVKGGGASPALATEAWKFGRFTWGANFASYLFYNADRWMINALTPGHPNHVLEQVGLYSTAVNIIVNIWIIPDAIQTSLLPKITRKGESERKKLVPPSLRAVTLLVVIGMVVLAVIGKPAIGFLYNRHISMTADYHENIFRLLSWSPPWDFTKAYVPMVLLMPGILTLSLAKVFTADFFSRGKPHYAMWVSVTSLVLNVILNLILIPSSFFIGTLPISGMNGAAIASSISYTFSFLMFLYYYVRESGERSRDIMLPKSSDFRLVGSWLKEAWARAGRKLDAVEDDDTVKLIGVDDEIDAEDMHRDQEDKQ